MGRKPKDTTGGGERAPDPDAILAETYPVEFPAELQTLWELANELAPKNPRRAFGDGFVLAGPFDVLAGERPMSGSKVPALMHWRFYLDPPEFFTVATGDSDGLHWGYWFDAPGERPPVVCSYYTRDAYEISHDGGTLVEALQGYLKYFAESLREYEKDDPDHADHYRAELERVARLQETLKKARWPKKAAARRKPNVPTFDRMGLIVPAAHAKGLLPEEPLYKSADSGDAKLLAEARAALDAEKLGLALQLVRAVWTSSGTKAQHADAAELMAQVYERLGRPVLAKVARIHAEHREIKSVALLA